MQWREYIVSTSAKADTFVSLVQVNTVKQKPRNIHSNSKSSNCKVRDYTVVMSLCSGYVLSLKILGKEALSIPRPGPQHDQRRLRLLHLQRAAVVFYRQAMEVL